MMGRVNRLDKGLYILSLCRSTSELLRESRPLIESIYMPDPIPVAQDRSAGGARGRTGPDPEPSVRAGSVSHRDHKGAVANGQ
jgi:hypothetical protein